MMVSSGLETCESVVVDWYPVEMLGRDVYSHRGHSGCMRVVVSQTPNGKENRMSIIALFALSLERMMEWYKVVGVWGLWVDGKM